jgi:hypothetical protein
MALGLKKISSPNGVVKVVGNAENLSLGGAFRVEVLARGSRDEGTSAKGEETTSVRAVVGVDAVGSVDVGVHGVKIAGANGEEFVESVFDIVVVIFVGVDKEIWAPFDDQTSVL